MPFGQRNARGQGDLPGLGVHSGRSVKDVMLAGNAYAALKDITAISKERELVSNPRAWFSGLFPYVQVGQLNVTT